MISELVEAANSEGRVVEEIADGITIAVAEAPGQDEVLTMFLSSVIVEILSEPWL